MSLAYYIVLDKDVSFDTFVNGKTLANVADKLSQFSQENHLPLLEDFLSQNSEDMDEFLDEFDEFEFDVEEMWFDAKEGIEWLDQLIKLLQEKQPSFSSSMLLEDLSTLLDILQKAQQVGAKWRLAIDL
ncbi:hypothetical protein [Sulfurimonas sp.]|uniref:hypothetical protein n=1 Tax=Sulfurimonas sp. TaxID=2022749 RepID=UPI003D140A27